MTRPEITTKIEHLSLLYRTLCKIDELAGEMGVQQHEFAGGYE